jgi:hypothetical protein
MFPSDEDAVLREKEKNRARVVHASTVIGGLGLLMGALMSVGEAAKKRFPQGAVVRALSGAVLAALSGGLGGLLGSLLMIQLVPDQDISPMARTILAHSVMLGMLGIGVGLAIGLIVGVGAPKIITSSAGAGLVAGVLAAVLFPIVIGLLIPSIPTDAIIPDDSGGVFGCVSEKGTWGVALWLGFAAVAISLVPWIVNRGAARTAAAN